jgi:hypothetical protein
MNAPAVVGVVMGEVVCMGFVVLVAATVVVVVVWVEVVGTTLSGLVEVPASRSC